MNGTGNIENEGERKNPYIPIVLHLVPRILTNLDRDRDSPTYGCFDRNYWHYKIRDYSSGLLQQCALTLALVYSHPFEGNIYYNKKIIRDYAISGITFCSRIQNRDGSFAEYWRGESSIPSTAFTLYAMCETCDLLHIEPDGRCISRAVHFLSSHPEDQALNQEMASIAAIRYASRILENDQFKQISDKKFENFLTKFKSEGWFSEYGGLDLSYLTVNLDYLVRYYLLSHDDRALEAGKKIIQFIRYFIHPDGSIGGEYGTRNTEYFAPYGIEYFKKYCAISNKIIEQLLKYIYQDEYFNLSCDERYYLHYLNHSFTKALIIYSYSNIEEKLPHESIFEQYFPESKIFIKSTKSYYLISNLSKGGTFKVMSKKSFQMSTDCGVRLTLDKNIYVSELPQDSLVQITPDSIRITGSLMKMNYIRQSTMKLLLLRILSLIFGYNSTQFLKKLIIFGQDDTSHMHYQRTLKCSEDTIHLTDYVNIGEEIAELRISDGLSVRHTASSKFFQINSINNSIQPEKYQVKGAVTIDRTIQIE